MINVELVQKALNQLEQVPIGRGSLYDAETRSVCAVGYLLAVSGIPIQRIPPIQQGNLLVPEWVVQNRLPGEADPMMGYTSACLLVQDRYGIPKKKVIDLMSQNDRLPDPDRRKGYLQTWLLGYLIDAASADQSV